MRMEVIIIIIIKTKYVNKNRKCVKILNTSIIPHFHPYTSTPSCLPACQPSCFLCCFLCFFNFRRTLILDILWLTHSMTLWLDITYSNSNPNQKHPLAHLLNHSYDIIPFLHQLPTTTTNTTSSHPVYPPYFNSHSLSRNVCWILGTWRILLVVMWVFFKVIQGHAFNCRLDDWSDLRAEELDESIFGVFN